MFCLIQFLFRCLIDRHGNLACLKRSSIRPLFKTCGALASPQDILSLPADKLSSCLPVPGQINCPEKLPDFFALLSKKVRNPAAAPCVWGRDWQGRPMLRRGLIFGEIWVSREGKRPLRGAEGAGFRIARVPFPGRILPPCS